MTSVFERAAELELRERADALEAHNARVDAIQSKPSASICKDCGAPISIERQQAAPGCTRCVPCQKDVELQHKRIPR